jgi:hypothetical protein
MYLLNATDTRCFLLKSVHHEYSFFALPHHCVDNIRSHAMYGFDFTRIVVIAVVNRRYVCQNQTGNARRKKSKIIFATVA